jgi:Kef-type K+ transport system membrane component KefB
MIGAMAELATGATTSIATAVHAVPFLGAAADGSSGGFAAERGLLLLAGLGILAFLVGHFTQRWISEVIVFLAIGIVVGPEVTGLVTPQMLVALDPVIALSLGAIIFGMGERLEIPMLRKLRKTLTPMAVLENLATFALALGGLMVVGIDFGPAYLLAAIAVSTSPTTLVAVISSRSARGRFTDHLLSLTAVNNVVSVALYGLGLPIILAVDGTSGMGEGVVAFLQLIVLSAVIGGVAGAIMRWLTPTLHKNSERLLFVLVMLVAVVAASRATGAPVVISTLVMGAWLANDRRDTRPLFGALRTLEAPIFLIFFVVAGAGVHLEELATVGIPGLVYVVARTVGKVAGGWAGAELTRAGRRSGWGPWIGAGLSPFASMAIGLAAFTLERASQSGLTELGSTVSAIVLGSVVVFELVGPIAIGRALDAVGDSGQAAGGDADSSDPGAQQLVSSILVPLSNPGMARRKAPQIVDLAASTGAVLTGLHVVPPDGRVDGPIPPALRFVDLVATSREVSFRHLTVASNGDVADTIARTARDLGVDLIVLGEPFARDGSGSTIVHDVTALVSPDIRVLVIPTGDSPETRPIPPASGPGSMPGRSIAAESSQGDRA